MRLIYCHYLLAAAAFAGEKSFLQPQGMVTSLKETSDSDDNKPQAKKRGFEGSSDYEPPEKRPRYVGITLEELLAQETKLSEEINYLSTQINSVDKLREEREQIYAEDDRYFRTMDERRERRNANGGGSEEQNRMFSSQFDEFRAKMEENTKRINEIEAKIGNINRKIQNREAEKRPVQKRLEEVTLRKLEINKPTGEEMDTF